LWSAADIYLAGKVLKLKIFELGLLQLEGNLLTVADFLI